MPLLIVAGAIALFVIVVMLAIYNRFVRLRNLVRESWRDIDTELQRRYDLIPNLVSTVQGYADHESTVLRAVTSLRVDAMAARRPPDAQAEREQALGVGVSRVMALAEQYPDLKASTQFLDLQHQLADTEDRIQVARRIYNANVRSFDTMVDSFPSALVARLFGFTVQPYFEVEPAVRDSGPPSVDLSDQR